MNKDFLHDFFHIASRTILIVPFVVIFIVLAVRYQVFNSNNEPLQNRTATQRIQRSQHPLT